MKDKLLKQLAKLSQMTVQNGCTPDEATTAFLIARKIREKLNLESTFIPDVAPLTYIDVDRHWQQRTQVEEKWINLYARKQRLKPGKFSFGAPEIKRAVNFVEMGITPTIDCWITRHDVILTPNKMINRILMTALEVLGDYLDYIKSYSELVPVLAYGDRSLNSRNTVSAELNPTDFSLALSDSVALTEAKIHMLENELALRSKKPLTWKTPLEEYIA